MRLASLVSLVSLVSLALLTPVLSALLSTACATAPTHAVATAAPRAREVVHLAVGNRWEYRVTPASPGAPSERVEVVNLDDEAFDVRSRLAPLRARAGGANDATPQVTTTTELLSYDLQPVAATTASSQG